MATRFNQNQEPTADKIAKVFDDMVINAIRLRASDIHIEPHDGDINIRFRVDGILKAHRKLPISVLNNLISRIKILARLDITERRLPQDGRLHFKAGATPYDLRVSTAAMVDGEKTVLRISYTQINKMKLEDAGYTEHNLALYRSLINSPNGLVLHVGPTGSGKTTSLYIAINHLNDQSRNIQTIEDPVEVRLLNVNQAQVNTDIGVTFASLLRAYLRQDCDVVLLGEIRDEETAGLAIQAALTGHLILGTLHANSAIGAISRLIEMDVAPFFVGTALAGVVSQRLVRKLCTNCRQSYTPSARIAKAMGLDMGETIYRARGCNSCGKMGYKGRMVLMEVVKINDTIRDAIHSGMASHDIEKLALDHALVPIFQDGLLKARSGQTSVEEVARVVKGVHLGK